MEYRITERGADETAAAFSDEAAKVLEWYQDEEGGETLKCARDTGLPHSRVRSICRGLVKEHILEIDREAEASQEESYGRISTGHERRQRSLVDKLFGRR